ncbi:MAG: NTP transferase domain-containing protein [Clostridiales bacterium]|jgi:hypothetical protein|nr:NTP transferase domain-containing protein [Clostridiales bacterium]
MKPVLVILAAGLGSRFGGLKQIAPVDDEGNVIIDYSIFDARRAGFETVVCVINPGQERDFRDKIGDRASKHIEVKYALQRLDDLPSGFAAPEGRVKPWGTAHAVLAAKDVVSGPFAVINADDFYGAASYKQVYDFLCSGIAKTHCAMVGFRLGNTLTENGYVSRGVCEVDGCGRVLSITERVHIEKAAGGAEYVTDDGARVFLPNEKIVSMNLWGLPRGFFDEVGERFEGFLSANLPKNPLKCEFFMPFVINDLLAEGIYTADMLVSEEKWLGITYAADLRIVRENIARLRALGNYPARLWGAAL